MSHPYMHPDLNDPTRRARVATLAQEAIALIERAATEFSPLVLASSLGAEDQVLLDLVMRSRHKAQILPFLLDTGRLHEETYALLARTEAHYGVRFEVYYPQASDVEAVVKRYGINGFYQSKEARLACCHARKVLPLARALAGKKAWLTGLRRQQSVTRTSVTAQVWDETHGLWKFSPLVEWQHEDVWAYIRLHEVPYHPLHDAFYPSIGCAPCTRAVSVGEDARAGRWWWEEASARECGLHQRFSPTSNPNPEESPR